MNFNKEIGTVREFYQHLLLFVSVHVALFFLLRMDTPPSFIEKVIQWIKEDKIWFYHKETGIFVTFIWFIILVGQGILVSSKSSMTKK